MISQGDNKAFLFLVLVLPMLVGIISLLPVVGIILCVFYLAFLTHRMRKILQNKESESDENPARKDRNKENDN